MVDAYQLVLVCGQAHVTDSIRVLQHFGVMSAVEIWHTDITAACHIATHRSLQGIVASTEQCQPTMYARVNSRNVSVTALSSLLIRM